jgi:hypothetical protein
MCTDEVLFFKWTRQESPDWVKKKETHRLVGLRHQPMSYHANTVLKFNSTTHINQVSLNFGQSDWDINTSLNENFTRSEWDIDPNLHELCPVRLGHRHEPPHNQHPVRWSVVIVLLFACYLVSYRFQSATTCNTMFTQVELICILSVNCNGAQHNPGFTLDHPVMYWKDKCYGIAC